MVYSKLKQLYYDDNRPNDRKSLDKTRDQKTNEDDCLTCRLVSGGGLTMLGCYVIKKYYDEIRIDKSKFKFSIKNNKSNSIYGFILGSFLLSIGLARLSNFQLHD